MIYWIGDLNYRITDLEVDSVKESIKLNKLEDLYQSDQLRNEIYKLVFYLVGWDLPEIARDKMADALLMRLNKIKSN